MTKKIINILLICLLLMPTTAFADDNIVSNVSDTNIEIENDLNTNTNQEDSNIIENKETITENNNELEQQNDSDNINESIIKNAKITSTDVSSCKVEWDELENQKVIITYTYNDISNTITTTKNYYNITNIPFNSEVKVVLSTDEEHNTVELLCNPSEDFKPVEIKDIPIKSYKNNNTGSNYYCEGLSVYNKLGEKIGKNYYTIEGLDKIKSSGIYKVKVVFKYKYENYDPIPFDLTVVPSVPSVGYNPINGNETSLSFSARVSYELCDNIVAEISTNSNFSNPIIKKIKPKNTSTYITFNVSNLKRNTVYYVRIRALKKVNGIELYSDPSIIKLRTTEAMPTYSWGQKDVKNIVFLMKKNKGFKYTFKHNYNSRKVYDFLNNIDNDYPQYSGRYYRSTTFNENNIVVSYTPSSKMKNYTKATKALDKIVKKAKKKKGVKAKVRYINKSLCSTCKYDYDTVKNTKKANKNAYNLYGVFVRHKAVCMGYAEAFHAICVQCGIQDKYVYSKNHVWNKVKVGKKWLHVDVTWNDCTHSSKWLLKTKHKG